jgi:hypothetical protein
MIAITPTSPKELATENASPEIHLKRMASIWVGDLRRRGRPAIPWGRAKSEGLQLATKTVLLLARLSSALSGTRGRSTFGSRCAF